MNGLRDKGEPHIGLFQHHENTNRNSDEAMADGTGCSGTIIPHHGREETGNRTVSKPEN
jgi:hypothetical protein